MTLGRKQVVTRITSAPPQQSDRSPPGLRLQLQLLQRPRHQGTDQPCCRDCRRPWGWGPVGAAERRRGRLMKKPRLRIMLPAMLPSCIRTAWALRPRRRRTVGVAVGRGAGTCWGCRRRWGGRAWRTSRPPIRQCHRLCRRRRVHRGCGCRGRRCVHVYALCVCLCACVVLHVFVCGHCPLD